MRDRAALASDEGRSSRIGCTRAQRRLYLRGTLACCSCARENEKREETSYDAHGMHSCTTRTPMCTTDGGICSRHVLAALATATVRFIMDLISSRAFSLFRRRCGSNLPFPFSFFLLSCTGKPGSSGIGKRFLRMLDSDNDSATATATRTCDPPCGSEN